MVKTIIKKLEEYHNPLANMGFFGVDSAKEHWKSDKILKILKRIEKDCNNLDEVINNE